MQIQLFVFVAFLVAQAFSIPQIFHEKSFTTDVTITEKDGSLAKLSWSFDSDKKAEKVSFHRQGGKNTINYRFYNLGVEYLVIEGAKADSCHLLPIAEKTMPSPTERSFFLTKNKASASWKNIVAGPVDASEFALPASCAGKQPEQGIFCSSCIDVGNQVIDLGCNATAGEIAELCGNLFESTCQKILDQACAGGCALESCAQDVCCLVDLCSGTQCNSSANAASKPIPSVPIANKEQGIFCSTCESVGVQVINLGCNATSDEIAQLCGNTFEKVCQMVLDNACAGGCALEACAQQACCLFDLCTGTQCSSSSPSVPAPAVVVPETPAKAEGLFCDSCVDVGKQVISLGCNATSTEIATLCGAVFDPLCKSLLETFCAGACEIENCPLQTCCLFDLCDGTQCPSNSTTSGTSSSAHYTVPL